MRTREDILAQLKDELPTLQEEYGVGRIALFGSYAKDEQREGSDADILVEFSQPIGFFDFMRLEFHLTDLLGVKVDLVTPDALRPIMRDSVLESAQYA